MNPTIDRAKPVPPNLPNEASREPQQGRSKASYERMLAAAEKLMVKRGSEDFTLTEVSKTGKVSIGSIYLRFDSKDDLISAVHARVIVRIEHEQDLMLEELAAVDGLDVYVRRFIERYAELLRVFAPILRPIMFRAINDTAISRTGQASAERLIGQVRQQMLRFSGEFGRPDGIRMIDNAFRIIYYTLARHLGLGSSPEAANEGNWSELKEDLAIMTVAFLRAKG